MANVGQLKGVRTRAKNEVRKVANTINPRLAEMEQHVEEASLEEIKQWEPFLGTNIPKLQGKLETLDQSTERLETFCHDTNNEAELQRLTAELDAGDDMEEFRDIVFRLRDLRERFRDRRLELKPKVEVNAPVAQAGPSQADMLKMVATAVTTAMAQHMPQQIQQPAAGAQFQAQAQAPLRVKLPKLELQKFSGDIMDWSGFWAQFSKAIDDVPNFPDIEKFQYLISHLEGEALQAISGYKFSEANYRVVVDLLKERYAKTQPIIEAYYSALNNMFSTTGQSTQLRVFYNEMERNLRSLEALDQNVDHLALLTIVKSKLPQEVLKSLEIHKPEADAWTMARLRQHLKRELVIRESLFQSQKTFHGSSTHNSSFSSDDGDHSQFHSQSQSPSDQHKSSQLKATNSTLLANKPVTREVKCVYCQKDHYPDECTYFPTVEDRQNKLKEQKRCIKCTSHNHSSTKCPSQRPCFHCSSVGTHHRSLCYKKFGSPVPHKSHKPTKSGNPQLSTHSDKTGNDDDSSDDTPLTKSTQHSGISLPTIQNSTLLASDESVIMQTARIEVQNPKDSSWQSAHTMFDCGATHTYVTAQFAKEMNLPVGKTFSLPVTTFGTDKVQTLHVHTTVLVLQLKDGTTMEIKAWVVPQISAPTQQIPYGTLISDKIFLSCKMADTVPMEPETCSYQLLIGQDYYFVFLTKDRFEIKPGLYLQGSKFGFLIAGCIKNAVPHSMRKPPKPPDPELLAHSSPTIIDTPQTPKPLCPPLRVVIPISTTRSFTTQPVLSESAFNAGEGPTESCLLGKTKKGTKFKLQEHQQLKKCWKKGKNDYQLGDGVVTSNTNQNSHFPCGQLCYPRTTKHKSNNCRISVAYLFGLPKAGCFP